MERLYIERLPEGLDAQDFIPHQKNPWSREQTCFNASKTKFVAAFNIYEHTMMNEMDQIIWGSFRGNTALGRVDKRDSHRAAGMIQTGIYNGDQLGTRSDVGRGMGVL